MAPFLQYPKRSDINAVQSGHSHFEGHMRNGHMTNGVGGHSMLSPSAPEEVLDLICIGFGPASLAIAIALQDELEATKGKNGRKPRVCFLEKQPHFAWHAGMLLPGAKMQISFIKDLATLRNPRSEFTFLNYLKHHDRLVQFSNLGTFLPTRAEFADYMGWCAGHFTDVVDYGQEVLEVFPNQAVDSSEPPVDSFAVKSRSIIDGSVSTRVARNVVIATGGKPHIPASFPSNDPRVIHSSQYIRQVPALLLDKDYPYSIAVVGSGQSAAEIFNDLHHRYPQAKTSLIIRDTALRPSDDSPFVNEIFNPERVDDFYHGSADARTNALKADRSTNYSVVRPELLDQIYHDLYQQRIKQPDESKWQHRILSSHQVTDISRKKGDEKLLLTLKDINPLKIRSPSLSNGNSNRIEHDTEPSTTTLKVDAVLVATGYDRHDIHEHLLKNSQHLLPSPSPSSTENTTVNNNSNTNGKEIHVRRDYKVSMDESKVRPNAGIWLQGCNEATHGLSDTLLSTLATRGGEMVESIFGRGLAVLEG